MRTPKHNTSKLSQAEREYYKNLTDVWALKHNATKAERKRRFQNFVRVRNSAEADKWRQPTDRTQVRRKANK